MGDQRKPLSGDDLPVIDAISNGGWQDMQSIFMVGGVFLAGGVSVLATVAVLPVRIWASAIASVLALVVVRHRALCRGRAAQRGLIWTAASNRSVAPGTSALPSVYLTYVLGSGGHTGELCELIKQSYQGHENLHRRYVLTSGDTHSPNIVARLETLIRDKTNEAGTWDMIRVSRARKVHQPLWTAPFTSLISAISLVKALTRQPRGRPSGGSSSGNEFAYPHVIVTNGPGTGFVVCLVTHILKLFFLVPSDRLKVVYIETWAHISTLSLTGKLFYYTDIADLFMVQHRPLAEKTGKPCLQLFKPPAFARSGEKGQG